MSIKYHITDNVNFRLDPKFSPDNNTTMGDGLKPGIFLAGSVEAWVNGYGYWRPWVVEFEVPSGLGMARGYSGENYVLATDYNKLRLVRVVPLDAHCREEFDDWGWTEQFFETTFDTFEAISSEQMNDHYRWRGYHYPGDARRSSGTWQQQYAKRVAKYERSHPNGAYGHLRQAWAARIGRAG